MPMSAEPFRADLERRDRFQFDLTFDEGRWEPILLDEAEPLGDGAGPNAARLLAGAVGNCLAASLLLCTEKAHVPLSALRARVEGTMVRNENGRLRIERLDVVLVPTIDGGEGKRFARCVDIFEDFCIVTQSVRKGIDVQVSVEPVFDEGAVEVAEGIGAGVREGAG